MNTNFDRLISAIKDAKAPVIYGLGGISMEEQRLAVRLARKLSGGASANKLLLPTVTFASLENCSLVLTAGGELPSCCSQISAVRDDRLLDTKAWRALSSLFRGNRLEGAEEYRDLYEKISAAESAAVVLIADAVDETFRRTVLRFVNEAHRVGMLQITSAANALGAYEIMLEEAGDAAAWFGGGLYTGCEFSAAALPAGSCDLILRVGCGPEVCCGDAQRFAIANAAYDGECFIEAGSAGGTALRCDGVPCDMPQDANGEILSLLNRLMEEVDA